MQEYGFLDDDPCELLECIDRELQQLSVEKVYETSVDFGLGGVYAYVNARILNSKKDAGACFEKSFLEALHRKAQFLQCEGLEDHLAIYQMIKFEMWTTCKECADQKLDCSEWMTYKSFVPANIMYAEKGLSGNLMSTTVSKDVVNLKILLPMKKYSYYNYMFKNEETSLLYNAASDGIIVMNNQACKYVEQNKQAIEKLADIHPDLFREMVSKEMIVEEGMDEAESVIDRWKAEDNDQTNFYLTILPTLSCNLRCWYCYEEHLQNAVMSDETRNGIIRFIDKCTDNELLRYFHLDFFGGEPLLHFHKTVEPILLASAELCRRKKKVMTLGFTTNGVLLSESVRNTLLSLDLNRKPKFQITLDGNKKFHDATRHTADNKPTYDIIVANIINALKCGMPVNCRFNYTANNIDSYVDILDEFEGKLTTQERDLLFFDFQPVWQEEHLADVKRKALDLAKLFSDHSFNVRIDKQFNSQRCKDDAENQASINFDGRVYKCTGINLTGNNCEGILDENGNIAWNENYKKRMEIKYGNSTCRACEIFPICHGGCSQTKLNNYGKDGCILNLDQDQRINKVTGRIEYILRNKRTEY